MTIKQAVDHLEKTLGTEKSIEAFEKEYRQTEEDKQELVKFAREIAPMISFLQKIDPISAYTSLLSSGVSIGQLTRDLDVKVEQPKPDYAFTLSPANVGLLGNFLRNMLQHRWSTDEQFVILEILKQLQEQRKVS